MNKGIQVGLAMAKPLCFIIAVILLVLAGQTFNADAQTETNLYHFCDSPDGANPQAGLVQSSDGNFYGTTQYGGTSTNCPGGCGTVFRISPSGNYMNLYSFTGPPNDGVNPYAGLVQASDGDFYGTTHGGGTTNFGTVFRISPSGSETTLYSFVGSPNDGYFPYAGLVQGSDGNFYGTTIYGGSGNCYGSGCGTVFRISPTGNYTSLHSFVGSPNDGNLPVNGLVQGSDGNFYGTTAGGGTNGWGTVFRISLSGSYTTLYSFVGYPSDGAYPIAGLIQGSDGNFYGTTSYGGTNTYCNGGFGCGTVFRISPSGSETTLYSFVSSPNDGGNPYGGLIQGSDGNFYGTTSYGGTTEGGTVFRISPGGSETVLYRFNTYPNDGYSPPAGLVQGCDGNFYGTTAEGGTNNIGTVFRISVPLNPAPNQISSIQLSATNIIFSIPSIAGETYQLQFTTDLTSGTWSNVSGVSVTNSIGSILTLTNFVDTSQPQGFYRFAITP